MFALTFSFILIEMFRNQIQIFVDLVHGQCASFGRTICHYFKHNIAIICRVTLQIRQFACSLGFCMYGQSFDKQTTKGWYLNAKRASLSIFMRHKKSEKRVETGILKTQVTKKLSVPLFKCMPKHKHTASGPTSSRNFFCNSTIDLKNLLTISAFVLLSLVVAIFSKRFTTWVNFTRADNSCKKREYQIHLQTHTQYSILYSMRKKSLDKYKNKLCKFIELKCWNEWL